MKQWRLRNDGTLEVVGGINLSDQNNNKGRGSLG